MSVNELSFILAKNNGNAPSAPNIPSNINTHSVARHTMSGKSPSRDSRTPAAVVDLPQQPAPAHVHYYPPTRGAGHTSRDGSRPTVESPLYDKTRASTYNPGTQLLQEIANAALYPVGTSGTSSVSSRTALNNKPAGNGSLPSPPTAVSSSSRNEATQIIKYVLPIMVIILIIIAVGVFVRR